MKTRLFVFVLQAFLIVTCAACSSCSSRQPRCSFVPAALADSAANGACPDTAAPCEWRVGERVSIETVRTYGVEKCFSVNTLSDSTFRRIWKKSYKANCTVSRRDLRYVRVLHYALDGTIRLGELVCNRAIAQDLVEIFRELFEARYPIERIELVDNYDADDETSMAANNTSCFNFRPVAGSNRLSAHSRGLAIDINPLYNPCVRPRRDGSLCITPNVARPYADRRKSFRCKITRSDLCYKLFVKHGFKWGGDWRSLKDYQHFEKNVR